MPPSGNPWSVKGIDPRARALAKTAARREGLTLGEWLNKVIMDDEPGGAPSGWDDKLSDFPGFGGGGHGGEDDGALGEIVQRLASRLEAAERRSTLALSGVDQSVLGLSRRLDAIEDEREDEAGEVEASLSRARAAQDELLERIRKLERTGPGTNGEALKAVETALGKFATRLYETENEVRSELDTLALKEERRRETSDKAIKSLTQRLDEAERKFAGEDAALRDLVEDRLKRSGEEASGLQTATRSLQQRLTAAEGATHRAAELLGRSHEQLEARLKTIEGRTGNSLDKEDFQRRFDSLAGELAEVIRATRADFARQIDGALRQGGDPALKQALTQAEDRIAAAERRQGEQLARIGEQIGKLAHAMERRLDESDRRLKQRLADAERGRRTTENQTAIEARLAQVREENASAVRKMGEEVAKLGNSLADRVQQAEHRSAQAMQAAGERMAQVVEKLQAQPASPEQDLQARISASEERTAKRIEDAMGKLHARLDTARSEQADALTPVQRAMSALADRLEAIEKRQSGGPETRAQASGAPEPAPEATPEPAPEPATAAQPDPFEPLPAPPGVEDASSSDAGFDIANERDSFIVDAEANAEPRQRRPEPARPAPERRQKPAALGATADADFLSSVRQTARTARPSKSEPARYRPRASAEPSEGGRGRVILIGASVLSFLIIGAAAGLLILDTLSGGGERDARAASAPDSLNALFAAPAGDTMRASAEPAPLPADPAVTAAPEGVTETAAEPASETADTTAPVRPQPVQAEPAVMETQAAAPVTLEEAANAGDGVARYQLALQRIEAGALDDAAALMRRAAEQAIPAAQFRYAQMLQRGEGVAANAQTARLWMVRAAQNGHVRAMHAAGAMYINAAATPDNQSEAARWFEQAALHGVTDSQFNLALLFQSGYGVPESPADAYAWLLIAAAGGDEAAGERAEALRRELTVEQRSAAEQVAAGFTPRQSDALTQGRYPAWTGDSTTSPAMVRRAQELLATLGYDAGPADGDFGPQTREAIVAYQSEQGLTRTGAVDAALLARLERSAPR